MSFYYADESDGVNHSTGASYPFYPIPDEAITQPYWIEGGYPGNANRRRRSAHAHRRSRQPPSVRALRSAVERQPVDGGSGAFFDLNTNARRPEGWTSADAAGLAILPGLVRYDEVIGAR